MKAISLLSKTKFQLFPPYKKKILIFDYNLYYKYKILEFFKTEHEILFTRFEKINIFILIKSFLKLKFSYFDYLQTYIDYVNPKLLITFNDNNLKFYKLNCRNEKRYLFNKEKDLR